MPHFTAADLAGLEKVYRLNLINAVTGYKPANLVGTAAPDGATNLAVISSVVHLGSNPALIGFIKHSGHRALHHQPRAQRHHARGALHVGQLPPGRIGV
jgi:hypothetical protein